MSVHYTYDSRDHHQPLNRRWRFLAYLLAVALLLTAAALFYRYFTDWSSTEGGMPVWLRFMTGFLCGLCAALLIGFVALGFKRRGFSSYQYLELDDERLRWQFLRRKGPQEIALTDIKYAVEDPRHLILKTQAGEEIWLENYLLIDEGEWGKFRAALAQVVTLK